MLSKTTLCLLLTINIFASENLYEEAGKKFNIDPEILWAIGETESKHNPRAINYNKNGTYDVGVMQINSIHFRRFNVTANDLFDPRTNIMIGAEILSGCYTKYGDSWMTINCYNGLSMDNVKNYTYAQKVYKSLRDGRQKYASKS